MATHCWSFSTVCVWSFANKQNMFYSSNTAVYCYKLFYQIISGIFDPHVLTSISAILFVCFCFSQATLHQNPLRMHCLHRFILLLLCMFDLPLHSISSLIIAMLMILNSTLSLIKLHLKCTSCFCSQHLQLGVCPRPLVQFWQDWAAVRL